MKGLLVAVLVVILLVVAGGAFLLLHSSSNSGSPAVATTTHSSSSSSTTIQAQGPADVAVSNVSCSSSAGTCVVSLVNSGGTVEATGCTMNGAPGVLSPKQSSIPAGALVNVSCSPASGNSLAIPGYHLNGSIQFSDGSSVQFTGSWQ